MTILGDKLQTVDDKSRDVIKFLPKIFKEQMRVIELNRSYRNTLEIAEYANQWADTGHVTCLERHGKSVEIFDESEGKEALERILESVSLGTDKYETAAILTMTEAEAKFVYRYLKTKREDVFYIDRNSSAFKKGLTVTTYYMAKGLEFDQVFVYGGKKNHPFFSQFRYIGATRALHELYICEK